MTQATKRNWWERRSAADDYLDDEDESDSWLDDFEFDDLADEDDVASIWGKYGTKTSTNDVERVVNALKVVQGFVDTFATGDKPYRVTFDEKVGTAGTDFGGRKVVVSHRPLFDRTIDDATANTVLTAMAVHEASHVRYGRSTAAAIKNHPNPRAQRISNCLDDVRIERRFVRDYPGYRDVFAPAIAYVAATPDAVRDTSKMSDGDLMVAAVRYAEHVDWTPETSVERQWWTDWAERWTRTDRVADHVAGVDEAIAHCHERDEEKREAEKQQAEQSESQQGAGENTGAAGESEQSESTPGGEPTTSSDDASGDETGAGSSTGGTPTDAPSESTPSMTDLPWDAETFPECFADAIDDVAAGNDRNAAAYDSRSVQEMVESGKALVDGGQGEVYWAPGGIVRQRAHIETVRGAASAIRAAFARSRTGHYATTRGTRSGRVDSRSLTRIASNDYRLFSQRTAPSVDKYDVWLMVDCSGSMSGFPIQDATSVASALATASRSIPTLSLSVWGWTSGFKLEANFGAVRVWSTGDPLSNIGYLPNVKMGGTPDAQMFAWAWKALRAEAERERRVPVLIVASDGAGSLGYYGDDLVGQARRAGVRVVSVAIGDITSAYQEKVYGPKGYIPWAGSIAAMAKPLGEMIARVVAGH